MKSGPVDKTWMKTTIGTRAVGKINGDKSVKQTFIERFERGKVMMYCNGLARK